MTESTYHPLSGLWQPSQLQRMYYGSGSVTKHLLSCLPSGKSKAFIITGSSLATKTPLIKQVESILSTHHAGTYDTISQHAPVAEIDKAAEKVQSDASIDTIISIGGGSPIDSAKAISSRVNGKTGQYLFHIAIPTTLSVAECTSTGGFAQPDGEKTVVKAKELTPRVIIYDSTFAKHTPQMLWLSTAIRALDHAVETMYNPTAAEVPTKSLALASIGTLFEVLPKSKAEPENEDHITRLQLACFSSLYGIGYNVKAGLGLSHSVGYALGSPYGIPHGITSCISLAGVVRLKAEHDDDAAEQIARIATVLGVERTDDNKAAAEKVADSIEALVERLGLKTTLEDYNVGEDQVGKIVQLATGGAQEELVKKVERLVTTFFLEI